LTEQDTDVLLDVAERAIVDGLRHRHPTVPTRDGLPDELRRETGAFVTLHVDGDLNGCIGSIETDDAVGVSVARHAWSAAFADPRLPPLRWVDYDRLHIEVSLLSPLAPMAAASRDALIDAIEPGVDGLLIAAGSRRAVFLPSVWDQLPTPEEFLTRLVRKAGLDPASWPADLVAFCFTTEKYGRHAAPGRLG
jgi:AmmeMemoRadiSam system protein A